MLNMQKCGSLRLCPLFVFTLMPPSGPPCAWTCSMSKKRMMQPSFFAHSAPSTATTTQQKTHAPSSRFMYALAIGTGEGEQRRTDDLLSFCLLPCLSTKNGGNGGSASTAVEGMGGGGKESKGPPKSPMLPLYNHRLMASATFFSLSPFSGDGCWAFSDGRERWIHTAVLDFHERMAAWSAYKPTYLDHDDGLCWLMIPPAPPSLRALLN